MSVNREFFTNGRSPLLLFANNDLVLSRTSTSHGSLAIITDPHKILLFSLYIKSTISVFKMPKQLSKENGGGPFCQQGNYQGPIYTKSLHHAMMFRDWPYYHRMAPLLVIWVSLGITGYSCRRRAKLSDRSIRLVLFTGSRTWNLPSPHCPSGCSI